MTVYEASMLMYELPLFLDGSSHRHAALRRRATSLCKLHFVQEGGVVRCVANVLIKA